MAIMRSRKSHLTQSRPTLGTLLCRARGLAALMASFLTFVVLTVAPASAEAAAAPAQDYARDLDVSLVTAEEHLRVQERGIGIVGELAAVLGDRYAGVWFDNDTGEFVVPLLPGADQSAVAGLLADDELRNHYRVATASRSWKTLQATQLRLDRILQSQIRNRVVQTILDPRTNSVVVREALSADDSDQQAIRGAAAEAGPAVEVRRFPSKRFASEPVACKTTAPRACGRPLRGGVSLTRDTFSIHVVGECSVGFKAEGNSYGNRFILTAGHCTNAFSKWGSEDATGAFHAIGSVEESTFPGGDWSKIKANGSTYWDWTPWPSQVAHYWEDQERAINSEAWSYVGQYVCHSGTSTGTSCGNVQAVGITASYGVNNLTEVRQVCAAEGDSGGPVFAGNTALGLMSGADDELPICENYGLYVEITDATDAMGVTVGARIGGAPQATTTAATDIGAFKATLQGEVNPNSVDTTYRFDYGPTTSYGSSRPMPPGSVGHGTGLIGVSVNLSDLQPDTTYHYRLAATSAAGTTYGADREFRTQAAAVPAVVQDSAGTIRVFLRSEDGQLREYYRDGTGWHAKTWGYANTVAGDPAAFEAPNGRRWVYYRRSNGQLEARWFEGSSWGENAWGYANTVAGDPAAFEATDGRRWVFYMNTGGQLEARWFNGSEWGAEILGS